MLKSILCDYVVYIPLEKGLVTVGTAINLAASRAV